MKRDKYLPVFLIALALLSGSASTSAWADRGYVRSPAYHGGHHHQRGGHGVGWFPGLVLGTALVWAATRPAVVYAEPAPPPVVVLPPMSLPAPQSGGDWYYCRPAGAYYPYVQVCPAPWERVPAGTN